MENNSERNLPTTQLKYSDKGLAKAKSISAEYMRAIIYWCFLGSAISGAVTYYVDKNYIKYKARPANRNPLRQGLFFFLLSGCLYRGKYFADLRFNIDKKELFSDKSNFIIMDEN